MVLVFSSQPRSKKVSPTRFHSTLATYFTAIFGALTLFRLSQIIKDDADNLSVQQLPPPEPVAALSGDNYSLAKEQSFGYFTDITNENWRIAQAHHASLFPNYYDDLNKFSNGPNDKGRKEKLQKSMNHHWYGYNFQVEFVCPLSRRLPSDSMADGPKWVCDPHRLKQKKIA